MEKIERSDCGKKIENTGTSNLCSDCQRRKNTKTYLTIAKVILVVGFFSGIILGNAYKIEVITSESAISSKYNQYEEVFNSALMLYSWIGTFLFDLFVFAIHSICYRLDLIIDKKEK